MKKTLVIILVFLISNYISFGQSKQQLIAKYFSALVNNKQFNGGVLVAEKNKIIYENFFGYADAANHKPNGFSTRFALASISKTLVATAIMQLQQQGKLNVNEPVTKYLPTFPYSNIFIRHLLSHTSGLPAYNAWFSPLLASDSNAIFTNDDFLKVIVDYKIPLLYNPGDKGNYDNVNYIVLTLLLEKISGEAYTSYIQKNILNPAGTHSIKSFSIKDQFINNYYPSFAYPYLQPYLYSDSLVKAADIPFIVNYWKAYNFSGFGQYIGTVWSLYNYAKAYSSNKLLTPATKQEMFQTVRFNNGQPANHNFALGWQVSADSSMGKIVYHSGNATGLSCVLLQNVSKNQVIIVYDNIHGNNAQETAFQLLNIINGRSVKQPRVSLAWLYGKALMKNSATKAKAILYKFKNDTTRYYLSEDEINLLGYDFLGGPNKPNPYQFPDNPKIAQALETFKLNVELFPLSWNVYDSYGEALLASGFKKEAIEMYKKSIELNPENKAGKDILAKLTKE